MASHQGLLSQTRRQFVLFIGFPRASWLQRNLKVFLFLFSLAGGEGQNDRRGLVQHEGSGADQWAERRPEGPADERIAGLEEVLQEERQRRLPQVFPGDLPAVNFLSGPGPAPLPHCPGLRGVMLCNVCRQVGTVVDNPVDFYHSRVPKKARKRTMVEELLADAEFRQWVTHSLTHTHTASLLFLCWWFHYVS